MRGRSREARSKQQLQWCHISIPILLIVAFFLVQEIRIEPTAGEPGGHLKQHRFVNAMFQVCSLWIAVAVAAAAAVVSVVEVFCATVRGERNIGLLMLLSVFRAVPGALGAGTCSS